MTTIEHVIDDLTKIVARAQAERSRLGFFAALYHNITIRVRDGIANGRFEDGPRLERLDVIFASRYLHALTAYRAGQVHSQCWAVAFRLANTWPPLILQHSAAWHQRAYQPGPGHRRRGNGTRQRAAEAQARFR
jgi:hypothetical protein